MLSETLKYGIKMLLLFVVGNVRVNLPLSPQARLMQRLEANARVEPFFHGLWARQPWPTRPYERLSDYTVPDDSALLREEERIMGMLRTSKRGGCGGEVRPWVCEEFRK